MVKYLTAWALLLSVSLTHAMPQAGYSGQQVSGGNGTQNSSNSDQYASGGSSSQGGSSNDDNGGSSGSDSGDASSNPSGINNPTAPAGYKLASSTADHESNSQKGPCGSCSSAGFAQISGPSNIKDGVITAAGGPSLFGAWPGCSSDGSRSSSGGCGACYHVINSGKPMCPACGSTPQNGPESYVVMITNQCTDCVPCYTCGPGSMKRDYHFDILNPEGWNNPDVFFKELPYTDCLKENYTMPYESS